MFLRYPRVVRTVSDADIAVFICTVIVLSLQQEACEVAVDGRGLADQVVLLTQSECRPVAPDGSSGVTLLEAPLRFLVKVVHTQLTHLKIDIRTCMS